MTDELVDVIDEEGKILKTVAKGYAHTEGLLHKTVIADVIDSEGRWLVIKQSASRQDPGQYVSPVGGHVSAGETVEEALRREAAEEIGLESDFEYVYVGEAVFNRHVLNRQENHLFVVYRIHGDIKPVLNDESDSYEYFTETELKNLLKDHPEQFGAPFHFRVEKFFTHLL